MADVVTERLRLAAGSLTTQATNIEALTNRLLEQLVSATGWRPVAPQGNPGRGGHQAAPAPGGQYGDEPEYEPPLALFEAELAELLKYWTKEGGEGTNETPALAPDQLRRVAELVELLNGEPAAKDWWLRAADAGDRLAQRTCRCLER